MSLDQITAAHATDVGRVRKRNEDSLACLVREGIFAVFDGMGGAAAGDVASSTAAHTLEKLFAGKPLPRLFRARVLSVRDAINAASRDIFRLAQEKGAGSSGTTAVVLIFDPDNSSRAVSLHAGDSRIYRLRDGVLDQMTRDHSFAEAAGMSTESDLPAMFRGVVTRAVGLDTEVALEECEIDVRPGDVFLLCSDGLTRMVSLPAIEQILAHVAVAGLQACADRFIKAANDAGGVDNTTVLIVAVGGLPAPPSVDRPPRAEDTVTDVPSFVPPAAPVVKPPRRPAWRLVLPAFVALLAVGLALLAPVLGRLSVRLSHPPATQEGAAPAMAPPGPAYATASSAGDAAHAMQRFADDILAALSADRWSAVEATVDDLRATPDPGVILIEAWPLYAEWSAVWRAYRDGGLPEGAADLQALLASMGEAVLLNVPSRGPGAEARADAGIHAWRQAGELLCDRLVTQARLADNWSAGLAGCGLLPSADPRGPLLQEHAARLRAAANRLTTSRLPAGAAELTRLREAWLALSASAQDVLVMALTRLEKTGGGSSREREEVIAAWVASGRDYRSWVAAGGPAGLQRLIKSPH